MLITRISPFSGKEHTKEIPITEEQYAGITKGNFKWSVPGKLIQDAFPNLTPGQREFIMTGITEEEWDNEFKDDPLNLEK